MCNVVKSVGDANGMAFLEMLPLLFEKCCNHYSQKPRNVADNMTIHCCLICVATVRSSSTTVRSGGKGSHPRNRSATLEMQDLLCQ
jgi:hypothetical protein